MNNIFDTNPGQLDLFTEPQSSLPTPTSESEVTTTTEEVIPIPKIQASTLLIEEPEPEPEPESLQLVVTPTEFDPVMEEELLNELKKSNVIKSPGIFVLLIRWFKRQMMQFRRTRKKYNIWKHKLGKIELDPAIRQEFRNQRKNVSDLFKHIDVVLDQIETQGSKVEKIEEFAIITDKVLNILQEQTELVSDDIVSLQEKTKMMR